MDCLLSMTILEILNTHRLHYAPPNMKITQHLATCYTVSEILTCLFYATVNAHVWNTTLVITDSVFNLNMIV